MAFLLAAGPLLLLPSDAHAQKVPWIVLPLAAAPLVAFMLAVILALAARSWSVGLANTGLVFVWVAWFVVASKYVPSDWVIWGSIVALGAHCLVMLLRILRRAFAARPRDGV